MTYRRLPSTCARTSQRVAAPKHSAYLTEEMRRKKRRPRRSAKRRSARTCSFVRKEIGADLLPALRGLGAVAEDLPEDQAQHEGDDEGDSADEGRVAQARTHVMIGGEEIDDLI